MSRINTTVLMSGARYFDNSEAINPYMDSSQPVNASKAQAEHDSIRAAFETAGITVQSVEPPIDCQDGVYTANWALVRGDTAVLARLPNARKAEEAYAHSVLRDLGKKVVLAPSELRFSGQGDALACGDYLLTGSNYRTDSAIHEFLGDTLGYTVVGLQTVPELDGAGSPVINQKSGWPDSFFYDIDLALSVLQPGLIAWCPEAFMPESQEKLRALPIEKIEVSLEEATEAFACNLVSTGETVVMSAHAPALKAAIEARGLKTITPDVNELAKGGGYIRCTSLTLDNQ